MENFIFSFSLILKCNWKGRLKESNHLRLASTGVKSTFKSYSFSSPKNSKKQADPA